MSLTQTHNEIRAARRQLAHHMRDVASVASLPALGQSPHTRERERSAAIIAAVAALCRARLDARLARRY